MANPFVHIELHAGDLAKAKDFYGSLFDSKLVDTLLPDGGSYTLINVGEGTGGGMMTSPASGVPPRWMAYAGVEDIVASTAKAKSLGATVGYDVMDVADYWADERNCRPQGRYACFVAARDKIRPPDSDLEVSALELLQGGDGGDSGRGGDPASRHLYVNPPAIHRNPIHWI